MKPTLVKRKAPHPRPRTRGERVCAFIETYCIVPDGELVGQYVKLEPFQRKFILALYDNPKGTRRAYLSMARKNGKALALDTKLPTPTGWTTMGEIKQGDMLFDEQGKPCHVTFTTPIQYERECFLVRFADGAKIVADAEHQWGVMDGALGKAPIVMTTQQMVEEGLEHWGGRRFSVPVAQALQCDCPDTDLPIKPYTLGVWLGDGGSSGSGITCHPSDAEIMENVQADGYPVTKQGQDHLAWNISDGIKDRTKACFSKDLRRAGLFGNKHIPAAYQRASVEARTALLQGLMDTDGFISRVGQCVFEVTREALARGALELIRGLGFKASYSEHEAKLYGRVTGPLYRIQFWAFSDTPIFRLQRKLERQKPPPVQMTRTGRNFIISIDPVPSVPVRCIQVDSPSSLFLAGEAMTPTHNTAIIACIVLAHLVGPEAVRNTQIISGAQSREQAAIVYELASKMVLFNPDLTRITRIVPSSKKIMGLTRNTVYHAISAEGKTAYGLSPVLAILDEVGQVRGPTDTFVDAIVTSQGAHSTPLLIAISTQSPNDSDMFSVWIDDALASKDPRIVCHLYAAPDSCELMDKAAWKESNPALGKFRSLEDLKEQAERAMRMPSLENMFRNLGLNQRVEVFSPFVSKGVWVLNSMEPDLSAFYEGDVYGGFDLSGKTDLTSLVLITSKGGKWHVRSFFWTPEKGLKDRARMSRTPLEMWAKQGLITVVPGAAIDYEVVAKDSLDIIEGMNLKALGFDRWRFDLLKKEYDELGHPELPLVPFGQGFQSMSPALELLEELLLNEQIAHGGSPVLTMCAMNSRVEMDAAGNRKLSKFKATGRIDGMVGLTMAVGMTNTKPEPKKEYQSFFV